MLQVTLFASHESRLKFERKIYVTLFGGTTLIRPTSARRILHYRQALPRSGEDAWAFFLTLFGSAEIKAPTLAEEFMDLNESIKSGVLALQEYDRAMTHLSQYEISVSSFTLFGGFSECELPSEESEVDSLAVQRHIGNIPSQAGDILQLAIGMSDSERLASVRRAVGAAR